MFYLLLLIVSTTITSQVNTWTPAGSNTLGRWFGPALVYSSRTDEFVLTMGSQKSKVYSVQVLPQANGLWINALPHDSLYGSAANANSVDSANGKWADSTGSAYSIGTNDQFGWRPRFVNVKGYLRPNLNCDDFGAVTAYSQFCYNKDDGKIYFYLNNQTFTYDPETRLFDTLTTAVHPNNGNLPNVGMGFDKNNKTVYALRWGSLCYDEYNKEIVAFGGGGIDQSMGSIQGTWVFNTTSKNWSKLTQLVVPSPRAHSPMVYDSVNRCIVMFGGDHLDCLMNDTWIYDCVTKVWSKKNPTVRPKPRAGHALVYLPKSKKIVMMGGYRYEANQTNEFEMWGYSVSENSWSLIKRFVTSDLRPKLTLMKPAFSGLVAVNSGDTVVAIGDSILSDFSNNPYAYKMALDASVIDAQGTALYGLSRDTIAVAGATYDPAYWYGLTKSDSTSREAALSSISQNAWTLISPPATPAGDRTWGSIIMDTERDRIIKRGGGHAAYCGTDLPNYFITENRWNIGFRPEFPLEMNGNNEPSPGPFTFNDRPFMPTHPVKSMVYDPIIKKALLIELLYTYVYDPDSMDFVKGSRIPAPVPSGGSQATYGQGTCTTPYGAYDLCVNQGYLFSADSMRWRKLPQTGVTLPNYYADCAGLTYDSKRDRIVYAHQAYGNMTATVKLYEYSFKTGVVTQLFPLDSSLTSGTNMWRECVYLPNLDIVLYTVRKGSGNVAYDCANNRWVTVNVSGYVNGMDNVGTGMTYDKKRNLVWIMLNNCVLYATRFDPSTTVIESGRNGALVGGLIVSPNPFSPHTSITIPGIANDLKKGALLQVFTPAGCLVADLSEELKSNRKVAWNGNSLPVGVYFVKFQAGNKVWQTKAVLVR